ncbi:MAG: amidohydrolase [Conexibacter sp.]|nr:amidohydrolase [Conexibacter sp.]
MVDVGTYVAPSMELIYESGVPDFRGHWDRMLPWVEVTHPRPGTGDWEAPYLRLTGRRTWPAALGRAGGEQLDPPLSNSGHVASGVVQDNARGRLAAMDAAGVERHLINAAPSVGAARGLASNMAAGVFGAYNRYAIHYCDADPVRLKVALQLHGLEPQWAAEEIRELSQEACVAAVSIALPVKIAPESSAFAPIWQALEETGLPLLHRASFSSPVWTPRYLLTYFMFAQVFERYPGLRIGFAESGVAWAPGAIEHLDRLIDAPGRVREYVDAGRIFAAVGPTDDAASVERAADELGPDALLWESYFPFVPLGCAEAPALRRAPELERHGDRFLARGS